VKEREGEREREMGLRKTGEWEVGAPGREIGRKTGGGGGGAQRDRQI
jgi:hypothetical protein